MRVENQEQNVQAISTCLSGAGGIMTTAADYLEFKQIILNGNQLNGKSVL